MKIAFLGLGAMGSRMAHNLVAKGFDLAVWNRSAGPAELLANAGARVCPSPRAASVDADAVLACVRDDDASRAIWLDPDGGALGGLRPGALAIESSTLSLPWTRALAQSMGQHGVDFLDAPVLGSTPQAEAASLIHVVGGSPASLERARPVLAHLGASAHLMGPAGSGIAMKLMVNALMGVQVAALAELLPQAARWGLDVEHVADVLGQTAACSPLARAAVQSMVQRQFAPLFPVALIEKDLSYLVDEPSSTPLSACAREVFRVAGQMGLSELNQTSVIQLYERPPSHR